MVQPTLIGRQEHDNYATEINKNTFHGQYTRDSVIVTLSLALSLYNSIELVLLFTTTFKKRKGLYYWSLTLGNYAVALYALGIMLSYFELSPKWVHKVILDIGWLAMIICQSLVLYSRLNLIFDNEKLIAAVKWMIISTSISILIPVIVLDMGMAYSPDPGFKQAYFYIEQIQMTCITLQELIISFLYVYKTIQLLRIISRANTRSMIWQLLFLNIIIISMDVAIVAMQFLHYQLYQETIKGFVYSVKLKLELHILSKLVDLVGNDHSSHRAMALSEIDSNAIEGQAQAEIRREMSIVDTNSQLNSHGISYGTSDEKALATGSDQKGQNTHTTISSLPNGSEAGDHISRVVSSQSQDGRTQGRESDLMYAEMMRSLSRG